MNVSRAFEEIRDLVETRRSILLKELEELDRFLRVCDTTLSDDIAIASEPLWKKLQEIHGPSISYPSNATLMALVAQILRDAGRPLSRNEIHRRLIALGARIPGDDPAKNLGTILWRSEILETKNRMYWFVGEERPPHTG